MAKKNTNKSTETVNVAVAEKAGTVTLGVVAPTAAPETAAAAPKKERKPGPYVDKAVGDNVPYLLSNGTTIQAVVTEGGHCACPTCSRRLATASTNNAQMATNVEERTEKRIAGLQDELVRIKDMIAHDRARVGKAPLTEAELLQEVMKKLTGGDTEVEAEEKAAKAG